MNKVADSVSIVLIGSFNPGIFQPEWFKGRELLPEIEANDQKIEIINNDIAVFTVAWLGIESTGDKFVARTQDESKFAPLRDLVIGIFRLLEQTPIKMMGINREVVFEFQTPDQWHAVGHALAPKKIWTSIKGIKDPGLLDLKMLSVRDDKYDGGFYITVKPSNLKPNTVSVNFNDHINIKAEDDVYSAKDVCKILEESWEASLSRSLRVAEELIKNALQFDKGINK